MAARKCQILCTFLIIIHLFISTSLVVVGCKIVLIPGNLTRGWGWGGRTHTLKWFLWGEWEFICPTASEYIIRMRLWTTGVQNDRFHFELKTGSFRRTERMQAMPVAVPSRTGSPLFCHLITWWIGARDPAWPFRVCRFFLFQSCLLLSLCNVGIRWTKNLPCLMFCGWTAHWDAWVVKTQPLSWPLRAAMLLFFLAKPGLWITGHWLLLYTVNDFPPTVTCSATSTRYSCG